MSPHLDHEAQDVAAIARTGAWRRATRGVHPADGWGCYLVSSSQDYDEWHHVDLCVYPDESGRHLNGSCTCEDFEFRCFPSFRLYRQVRPYALEDPNRTQCRHIEKAKGELLREVLWRGITNELTEPNKTP